MGDTLGHKHSRSTRVTAIRQPQKPVYSTNPEGRAKAAAVIRMCLADGPLIAGLTREAAGETGQWLLTATGRSRDDIVLELDRPVIRVRDMPIVRASDDQVDGIAEGTIYLVGFADFVKIGFTSKSVGERVSGLQTACPLPIIIYKTMPGTRELERELHARFSILRLNGEWFSRSGSLAEWIRRGCPHG